MYIHTHRAKILFFMIDTLLHAKKIVPSQILYPIRHKICSVWIWVEPDKVTNSLICFTHIFLFIFCLHTDVRSDTYTTPAPPLFCFTKIPQPPTICRKSVLLRQMRAYPVRNQNLLLLLSVDVGIVSAIDDERLLKYLLCLPKEYGVNRIYTVVS